LAAAGLASDHIEATTHNDEGVWVSDGDGRQVWRRSTP
jgi:hypothetical protein